MLYNSNNWNLIAKIIYELQIMTDIDGQLLAFKALEEEPRREMLEMIVSRLKKSGFPNDTGDTVYDKLVEKITNRKKTHYLMEALCYIDQKLVHQNEVRHFMLNSEASVSPMRQLNINAEELGILILPRLYCSWSRKGRDKFTELSVSRGINELMQSYYYVDVKALGGFKVHHYMMNNPEKDSVKFLRIAVSPLTNGNVLAIKKYSAEGCKKIAIVGVGSDCVEDESEDKKVEKEFYVSRRGLEDKVLKVIDKAAEIKADILMFPEMLGTKEIREQSLERLACLEIETNGMHPPSVTLLPTEWEYGNCGEGAEPWKAGNNTNTLYVACSGSLIEGEGFKETFRQQKQNPYLEKAAVLSGAVEDIKADKSINVLHIPNLGRIVFPICADLLAASYRKILIEVLGATLVLCPSFSKGFDDFIQLTNIGNPFGCRIVWCDSCAVRHLYEKNTHGVFKECDICCIGAYGGRNYTPIKPQPQCKDGKCGNLCLFYIDIPLSAFSFGDVSGKLRWQHLTA